jgi:hypothetical protein
VIQRYSSFQQDPAGSCGIQVFNRILQYFDILQDPAVFWHTAGFCSILAYCRILQYFGILQNTAVFWHTAGYCRILRKTAVFWELKYFLQDILQDSAGSCSISCRILQNPAESCGSDD